MEDIEGLKSQVDYRVFSFLHIYRTLNANKGVTVAMKQEIRILIGDNDISFRDVLAEQLEHDEEFTTVKMDTGGGILDYATSNHCDLILLGTNLSDIDSHEACRKVRRADVRVPIIMLVDAANETESEFKRDNVVDDYVTKPLRVSVLVARIRNQLRLHAQSEDEEFTVGPFTCRPGDQLLCENSSDRIVRLTEKETAILRYLHKADAKVVHRNELLREVWGYNANVLTHTLETHIYRLRRKIERDPSDAALLITEIGGYRLQPR